MKLNRLTAVLLLCMLCFSLVGCAKQDEYPKTIRNGDYNYEISEIEPLSENEIAKTTASLLPPGSRDYAPFIQVIAKGKVSNIREIEIRYGSEDALKNENAPEIEWAAFYQLEDSPDSVGVRYATLFDFTVEEYYLSYFGSSSKAANPQTITVYYDLCSHMKYLPDEYMFREGGEYYLFLTTQEFLIEENERKAASDDSRTAYLSSQTPPHFFAADYFIWFPQDLVFPADLSMDALRERFQAAFDNELNATASSKAFLEKQNPTIEDFEEFLRGYGRILSEQSPVPEDATPAPEDMTPAPDDDASKRQDG